MLKNKSKVPRRVLHVWLFVLAQNFVQTLEGFCVLEKVELSADFVKLDLKIQGRRQAQPLAWPIRLWDWYSICKNPHKAGRATHSLASQEAEGAGAWRPFILSVPQLRCWGTEGATEAHRSSRCACRPNDSHGCLIKPQESEFSSLFISYKLFFSPLKDSHHLFQSASKVCFKNPSCSYKGRGRAGVLQAPRTTESLSLEIHKGRAGTGSAVGRY